MKSQFSEQIRELRENQNLSFREVAPLLKINTDQLSKIEKGFRKLKREQIPNFADLLKTNSDELMTIWLAKQIYVVVKNEKLADKAM